MEGWRDGGVEGWVKKHRNANMGGDGRMMWQRKGGWRDGKVEGEMGWWRDGVKGQNVAEEWIGMKGGTELRVER